MRRIAIKQVRGGITAPRGFLAAGIHVGIKKPSVPDLALIASVQEGPVAGVFTTNRVVAAPVLVDRLHLRRGRGRAIIVNSGCANAFTGAQGLADAKEMADLVARRLGVPSHTVFVASTGVIGGPLPMAKIRRGVPLALTQVRREGGAEAARAIMTTDTCPKQIALQARIAGHTVTVGGIAKGSGMIHPDMATMLAFLTTDAAVPQPVLQRALRTAVDQSFNCISVDGDTSTNDTVLCLANGLAGLPLLRERSEDFAAFQRLLNEACLSLALQVCRDGEGATKLVRIHVTGARRAAEARQVARTVATSCLVKTALFGEDANWGRIMAAVGRAGAPIDQRRITLSFDDIPIAMKGGTLGRTSERRIARIVRRKEFTVRIDLGQGSAAAQVWTTDLSYEYVKINASYRT
ncbi:MAG: bifunctional glutamate N-acetyltransferase/amino-acid acetyltransferase ArgJ [Nitrospira sp.]|nr:bifunctional glutamate N-acetyltransferase/amino-acid acetyltransferase ArgJ [Nitrospira sp.]